jgi:hypothetical protein
MGIIIGTLLIGVIIGALIVGPLVARHHFKRMANLRTPRGFSQRLEEIIEPDDSQAEALRTVLARYGEDFDEVASRHRSEVKDLIDSLNAELDTILTPEQKERLEKHRRRMVPPGDMRNHHKPPRPK